MENKGRFSFLGVERAVLFVFLALRQASAWQTGYPDKAFWLFLTKKKQQ